MKRSKVNKFGGKAVSKNKNMLIVANDKMSENPGENAVVVSAYEGVTDLIVGAMDEITKGGSVGSKAVKNAVAPIEAAIMEQYDKIPGDQSVLKDALHEDLRQLKQEIRERGISDLNPRPETFEFRDRMIRHLGEGAARRGTTALYNAHDIPAFDMGEIMVGRDRDVNESAQTGFVAGLERLGDLREEYVLVAGGDVGGLERGVTLDMGRSYSDPNAVNLALALRELGLGGREVIFWKPEPGMMTADPTIFKELENQAPQLIPYISQKEALEVARGGSSLLHVGALELAYKHKLNLRLRGVSTLEEEGTAYSVSGVPTQMPFKTIATHPHDSLSLDITDVAGEPGVNEHIGRVFGEAGISVNDIMTEGNTIVFTIPMPRDEADKILLRHKITNIQGELSSIEINGVRRAIDTKWSQENMANVCVVGSELENQEGVLAGLTNVLASIGINIDQLTHTEEQRRISFYVPYKERDRAVRAIHMAYFDQPAAYAQIMAETQLKTQDLMAGI